MTVDVNGYIYDFGHYTPVNRVTIKGGQYLVEDANVLVTVDDRGMLYRKYEMLPKKIIGKGMNYFIGDSGQIFTIDNMGFSILNENQEMPKKPSKFGGIFFITEADEFFSITSLGELKILKVDGLKGNDILAYGGNYFMTNRGVLFTISMDGKIFDRHQDRVGIIVKKGGNYFVDSSGALYTIAHDGSLKLPPLPINLKTAAISKIGANYFIDGSGKLFSVDKEGNVFERSVNYDLKLAKIISL